ncbi:MAG: ferritin family protein [Spirochaetaceae bacterium]|nr:ferritin family protein [Spirochaetaceae bacterium]
MDALMQAIKNAMKAEVDSVTIYSEAALRAEGDVAEFFASRADEEKRHYNWLLQYYKELLGGHSPSTNVAAELKGTAHPSPIFSQEFLRRVASDRHLSAAVSSAVLLELNATEHYRTMALQAHEPHLKAFLNSLADWESRHYADLLKIQDESRQYWFEIQNFEPF